MTEAVFVNFALTLRVLLVGSLLLALPRITRKGLVFGAYVGEATADRDAVRQLRRSWDLGCAGVMLIALVVGWGISLAGWPVTGNFTGTGVLLVAALVLYVRTYARAVALAPADTGRQAQVATASLSADAASGTPFARAALALCVATSVATFAYSAAGFVAMPDQVPTLASSFGRPELTGKSLVAAMWFPGLNLVLSPFLALLAVLTARAKHSLRGGTGGRSLEGQTAFRAAYARLTGATALFFCAGLTVVSVQVTRVGLAAPGDVGPALWWVALGLSVAMIAFVLASMVRVARRYGQGGALRERAGHDSPVTGGLADNAHWIAGLFYVNRSDPSMMIEKRFGLGYTLNYGNPVALLLSVSMFALLTGLVILGALELMS